MALSCKPIHFFSRINLIIEKHEDITPQNLLFFFVQGNEIIQKLQVEIRKSKSKVWPLLLLLLLFGKHPNFLKIQIGSHHPPPSGGGGGDIKINFFFLL